MNISKKKEEKEEPVRMKNNIKSYNSSSNYNEPNTNTNRLINKTNSRSSIRKINTNTTLMKLPNELLLKILSHLSLSQVTNKISPVNRSLRQLCLDPTLWTHLRLPPDQTIPHLRITHPFIMSRDKAIKLVSRCTMLVNLHLERRNDSNEVVITALEHCPMLKVLDMDDCKDISNELINAFRMRFLEELRLSNTGISDSVTPMALAESLRYLTAITVDGLFNTPPGWKVSHYAALIDSCENLKELIIPQIGQLEKRTVILEKISSSKIKSLSINGDERLTDYYNLAKCRQLEKLALSPGGSNMSAFSFLTLSTMKELRSLTLSNVSTPDVSKGFASINEAAEIFPNLTHLDIYCSVTIDDECLKCIADCCPKLVDLSLRWCDASNPPDGLTATAGIKHLLLQCKELMNLEVRMIKMTEVELVELRRERKDLQIWWSEYVDYDSLKESKDMMCTLVCKKKLK